MNKIGSIHLGLGTIWEDTYNILEVVKRFQNGKIAIRVNFKGKSKVFNVLPKFICLALLDAKSGGESHGA